MAEAKDEAGGLANLGEPTMWRPKHSDQALSATTAESEPAPVAEAPKRVTHTCGGFAPAYDCLGCFPAPTHDEAREIAQRYIDCAFGNDAERPRHSIPARPGHDDDLRLARYIAQQEQSEREVASASHAATAIRECYERDVSALQSQLTDANLKAEGLRVDNEELKAKLAESERKLADVRKVASDVAAQRNAYQCQLLELQEEHGLPRVLRSATEPAGVEADNADPTPTEPEAQPTWYVVEDDGSYNECATVDAACELLDCATEEAYITTRKPEMPAPTETEAPARFRVGQLCRKNYEVQPPETGLVRIVALETIDGDACARFTYECAPALKGLKGYDRLSSLTPVDEPADPVVGWAPLLPPPPQTKEST